MLFSYGCYARQIINNRKNAADSLAISMAMRIRRYGAEQISQYGRTRATLDATGCRHRESMVIGFGIKKSSCGVVKLLFKASVQKARNGPSTQLIEVTSCVERSNAIIKAEEHSELSSYHKIPHANEARFFVSHHGGQ